MGFAVHRARSAAAARNLRPGPHAVNPVLIGSMASYERPSLDAWLVILGPIAAGIWLTSGRAEVTAGKVSRVALRSGVLIDRLDNIAYRE